MTKRQLREEINKCFEQAETPGLERGPLFARANFYIQELDRRHDSWISLRDLILEIVVIALIFGEILLGVREGVRESTEFEKEQEVMGSLSQSTASTAEILNGLEATMDLKGLDSRQPINHLPVSVDVNYEPAEKRLVVTNMGSSNIEILDYQFDGRRGPKLHSPQKLAPGEYFPGIRSEGLMDTVPEDYRGQPYYLPLRVTLTGANGKTYRAITPLALTPLGSSYHVSCGRTSVTEVWWPKSRK